MADINTPVTRHRVKPVAKDILQRRVIIVGDCEVGKTALVRSFCKDLPPSSGFPTKYEPTIGIDFKAATMPHNGKELHVAVWDLGGHSSFSEVREEFYKECQGVILAFDVTSRKTFQNLDMWLDEAKKFSTVDLPYVVVGLKIESGPRIIAEQAARDWAKNKGFTYFEASSVLGKGTDAPFKHLAALMV